VITYPHHPNYITRTIVGAANSEYIKGEMVPCGKSSNEADEVSVMILKYNECSPFKYEVIVTGGLVLRFGGETYPPLPIDVEVTIGMVDNYPHDGRKHSVVTHESWQSFCTPQRMDRWRDMHSGLPRILAGADDFVWNVGCLIETVVMTPTVLKVYSIRMKVDQLKEIEHGYPRSQGEGKSEEDPT
jgi:hypothetical protein